MKRAEAIDVMARQVIHAENLNDDDWEVRFPGIRARDWARIYKAVQAFMPPAPTHAEFTTAYSALKTKETS